MSQQVDVTGEVLFQKYHTFKDLAGTKPKDQLTLSQVWLDHLKKQLGLVEFKQHNEATLADLEAVKKEVEYVQMMLKEVGYGILEIYNMDKTGLFYG